MATGFLLGIYLLSGSAISAGSTDSIEVEDAILILDSYAYIAEQCQIKLQQDRWSKPSQHEACSRLGDWWLENENDIERSWYEDWRQMGADSEDLWALQRLRDRIEISLGFIERSKGRALPRESTAGDQRGPHVEKTDWLLQLRPWLDNRGAVTLVILLLCSPWLLLEMRWIRLEREGRPSGKQSYVQFYDSLLRKRVAVRMVMAITAWIVMRVVFADFSACEAWHYITGNSERC